MADPRADAVERFKHLVEVILQLDMTHDLVSALTPDGFPATAARSLLINGLVATWQNVALRCNLVMGILD